ncbi:hypothetical protein CJF31_00003453 [Rutstroemia sp. NJR-2017a BVV2]|nr:hypothetical protein CJF31_00003453 [Rutstroemia sp. NJR-2017a BVV2]
MLVQPLTLYILDSSFNPPTLAHMHLCLSALHSHRPSPTSPPPRLLLLLSTLNADKGSGHPSTTLPQRLVGIEEFAKDLHSTLTSPSSSNSMTSSPPDQDIAIDIALTTQPFFHQKSHSISTTPSPYPDKTTHIHLTGFDTLIRVLNPKYYSEGDLSPLVPFLGGHGLRVAWRDTSGEDGWSRGRQEQWVREMKGRVEEMKGVRGWFREGNVEGEEGEGKRGIEMVDLEGKGSGISSSRVREVVREVAGRVKEEGKGEERGQVEREELKKALDGLVSEGVREWIVEEGLYKE